MTFVANTVITAAQLNTHLRDNLNETAAAKATTAGRIFVATGSNSLAERVVAQATIATSQTTTTTGSFVDLTTPGPAVTVTTGTICLVALSCNLKNSLASTASTMAVAVSGASTVAADAARAVIYNPGNNSDSSQQTYLFPMTGLTAGSNTFTAKYAVNGGTGTFANRVIVVFPFGS